MSETNQTQAPDWNEVDTCLRESIALADAMMSVDDEVTLDNVRELCSMIWLRVSRVKKMLAAGPISRGAS